ncbi:hypothetical protein PanWU01x14_021900 [Parasponia andersonii]|uniref:Uncharacterized protein n=1 Tax=Parasponia andersonii TaxID=3476 RepID=A0A2P5DY36_PARAD|nr:hypothetical protein PanWU01x14_021900 [Parasponia andersonii]
MQLQEPAKGHEVSTWNTHLSKILQLTCVFEGQRGSVARKPRPRTFSMARTPSVDGSFNMLFNKDFMF